MLRLPCRCGRSKTRPVRRTRRKAPKAHVLRRSAHAHVAIIARPRARHMWDSLSHGPTHKPRERSPTQIPLWLQNDHLPESDDQRHQPDRTESEEHQRATQLDRRPETRLIPVKPRTTTVFPVRFLTKTWNFCILVLSSPSVSCDPIA